MPSGLIENLHMMCEALSFMGSNLMAANSCQSRDDSNASTELRPAHESVWASRLVSSERSEGTKAKKCYRLIDLALTWHAGGRGVGGRIMAKAHSWVVLIYLAKPFA